MEEEKKLRIEAGGPIERFWGTPRHGITSV